MIKKILKFIGLLVIIFIIALITQNEYMAYRLKNLESKDHLDQKDLKEIKEVIRVKDLIGNKLFSGFGNKEIGILFFNDKYEFLNTTDPVDQNFTKISENIYRREAKDSQAFAVLVNEQYVGSIPMIDNMNKMYFLGIRSELPIIVKNLFPYQMASIKRDMHVSAALHEMFHAYQAETNFAKFSQYENGLSSYPYFEDDQEKYWNKEGHLLYLALNAENKPETINYTKQFLDNRNKRRGDLSLNTAEIEFEKGIEWLEGLAKYVEITSYQLASDLEESRYGITYKEDTNYWDMEINRLDQLGELDDFRFYISGYAQAKF